MSRKGHSAILPSKCKICQSAALYSYYGVVSCYACKMFFKRNGEMKPKMLKCNFHNQCEINGESRNICSSCRLDKCFINGMKVEMFRSSVSKKRINRKMNPIRLKPLLSTRNIYQSDKSLLNNSEWSLISNLIHNYDQSKLLSIIESFQKSEDHNVNINETLIRQFILDIYKTAGICLSNNRDITNLSSNDRSILVHTAANNVTWAGATFISYHSQLIHNKYFTNYFERIYGKLTMEYYSYATKMTESDPIIFKLALGLFIFSPNSRIFHQNLFIEYTNLNSILDIQNKYAEVTWKYLLVQFGYDQAIIKYLHLIQWLLSLCNLIEYAHHSKQHNNDIISLIEQTELTLILDEDDEDKNTNPSFLFKD